MILWTLWTPSTGTLAMSMLDGDVSLVPIAAKRRPTRIFFIDDDLLYAEPLVVELAEQGFEVQHFAETVQLEALLAQPDGPDILLLDWHLPKSSGIAIAQSLRRRGMKLPIVFLTGRNYIEDERQAFECGAADFVAKSKGVETLVWRLKRVAANLPGAGNLPTIPSAAADGRLNLYRQTSRATWDGIDLDLTLGEYNVVELLALNASNYISYRALYDVVRAPGFRLRPRARRIPRQCSFNHKAGTQQVPGCRCRLQGHRKLHVVWLPLAARRARRLLRGLHVGAAHPRGGKLQRAQSTVALSDAAQKRPSPQEPNAALERRPMEEPKACGYNPRLLLRTEAPRPAATLEGRHGQ